MTSSLDAPKSSFLVIGGARGIGLATVQRLMGLGHHVVVCDPGMDLRGEDSDPSVVKEAVAGLADLPGSAMADHRDPRHYLTDILRDATASIPLTGVFCFAGALFERTLVKTTDEDIMRILDIHTRLPLSVSRQCAAYWMSEKQPGSIVLCGGPSAFFGAARHSTLGAAFAATAAATRSAALELRKHRIRINMLIPTAKTRQTENLPLFKSTSSDSLSPDHVAAVATWLVTEQAVDVSGEILGVAGSRVYTLQNRETTGSFAEGELNVTVLNTLMPEVLRGH